MVCYATPRLQLSQTALGPVAFAAGSAGPAQIVCYSNAGDGSLNLQVSSSVTWAVPALKSESSCHSGIEVALQTASLPAGLHTGVITVSDPNALDAPQLITVTVAPGGAVPDQIDLYAPPQGSASTIFGAAGAAGATASTQTGGAWLSVTTPGLGSFRTSTTFKVAANVGSLAAGDYNGKVTVGSSAYAADDKNVAVALHVTGSPIAQAAPVSLRIVQGSAAQQIPVTVANAGQGTLTVSGATPASSGTPWLTAAMGSNNVVNFGIDPGTLAPGTYESSVNVASNAANGAVTAPVRITVIPAGPPFTYAGGVVNNGTYGAGEALAQGDIVALFGEQLAASVGSATALPLGTTLNDTQVLLNGNPVPAYYVAPGQIDFQVPYDAAVGAGTVRVVRGSQQGNAVALNVAARAPRLLLINGGPYAIYQNPTTGGLTGLPDTPTHIGDTIVVYAIGFGQTSPPVVTGAASPTSPLAQITPTPEVCFGQPTPFGKPPCATPLFAGLTPNFVGLYQINVTIPPNAPQGNNVPFVITLPDSGTGVARIAIQ